MCSRHRRWIFASLGGQISLELNSKTVSSFANIIDFQYLKCVMFKHSPALKLIHNLIARMIVNNVHFCKPLHFFPSLLDNSLVKAHILLAQK